MSLGSSSQCLLQYLPMYHRLRVRCCCLESLSSLIFLDMTAIRTRVTSRMLSTMPLTMSRLLKIRARLDVLDVSEVEKLLEESGLAFGRGPDLCLDID